MSSTNFNQLIQQSVQLVEKTGMKVYLASMPRRKHRQPQYL